MDAAKVFELSDFLTSCKMHIWLSSEREGTNQSTMLAFVSIYRSSLCNHFPGGPPDLLKNHVFSVDLLHCLWLSCLAKEPSFFLLIIRSAEHYCWLYTAFVYLMRIYHASAEFVYNIRCLYFRCVKPQM